MEGDADTREEDGDGVREVRPTVDTVAGAYVSDWLFFPYWKMAIEPEKQRNCERDQDGRCVSYNHHGPRAIRPDSTAEHWALSLRRRVMIEDGWLGRSGPLEAPVATRTWTRARDVRICDVVVRVKCDTR